MLDRIRAKVAKILNSREVVITAGQDKGVRLGMYFDVLDEKGEEIKDPETQEILGSLERKKVRLKITDVREKLAIARTYKSTKVNIGGDSDLASLSLGPISRALMPPKWITKYQTIRTDELPYDDIDEEESFVKIGDPVVQVTERVDPSEVDEIIGQ